MITRPVRERSLTTIGDMVEAGIRASGFEEVGLLSLSSADHTEIGEVAKGLADRYEGTNVSLSLPSTRVDAFNITLANEFSRNGRRSGLTFAPEGGSDRMRKVINKMVSEEDLIRTVAAAYSHGWRQVRLRGGRPALALSADTRDRRGRQGSGRPLRGHQRLAVAAEHPGRRLQHHAGQRVHPQRPPLGPDLRPEGGSERMRKVINKMVTEEDLIRTVSAAYSHGWRQVKLYFMVGLPTETDEDVLQIAELAKKVIAKGREVSGRNDIRCTVSIGGFVPKPHTPFQWAAQLDHETTDDRLNKLRDTVRDDKKYGRAIGFRYHDGKPGIIEGLLSRGDRRVGAVIEQVWRDGGRFDGWSEHFSYERWMRPPRRRWPAPASTSTGTPPASASYDEVLPWDHLDSGLDKDWLWADWEDALDADGPASRSRTAAGRPATTAGSAPRWAPRSRSAPPARRCSRSPSSDRSRRVTRTAGSPGRSSCISRHSTQGEARYREAGPSTSPVET